MNNLLLDTHLLAHQSYRQVDNSPHHHKQQVHHLQAECYRTQPDKDAQHLRQVTTTLSALHLISITSRPNLY